MAKKIAWRQIDGLGNPSDYSKKNTQEEWDGQKILKHSIPFVIKQTGVKSWLLHKSNWNGSLFLAMSASNDGDDWNWSNQIEFKDSGQIKGKGFEIAGKDDKEVLTAGGNSVHKKNLLWSMKDTWVADGSDETIYQEGLVTNIEFNDGYSVDTLFRLRRTGINGQVINLLNISGAEYVHISDSTLSNSFKLYNGTHVQLTFFAENNGTGVLQDTGHWTGTYQNELIRL